MAMSYLRLFPGFSSMVMTNELRSRTLFMLGKCWDGLNLLRIRCVHELA